MQMQSSMNGAQPMSVPPTPPPDDDVDAVSSDPIAAAAALRRLLSESTDNRSRFDRIEAELADIRKRLANVDRTWVVTSSTGTMLLAQSLLGTMTDLSPVSREIGVVLAMAIVGIVGVLQGARKPQP